MKKQHITARVPSYVVKYCKDHNLTYSQLCMQGFDSFRSTDEAHALSRLEYHEDRVLHWKQIVLQHDNECGTKQQFCNTVKEAFDEQGRGSPETKRLDMSWLEAKADSLIDKGIVVTSKELYNYCKGGVRE